MRQVDTNPRLPPELWKDQINSFISINDSCSLALVSKSLWGRSREHKKWRNLQVNWDKIRERGAYSLFQCPSFKRVKKLILSKEGEDESDNVELIGLLYCSLHCSNIKEIKFDIDISEVPAKLLSSAIAKLDEVTFSRVAFCSLTNQQVTKILEESPKLINLVGPRPQTKFTNRSALLLSDISNHLKKLDISSSGFTTEHMKHILQKCLESATLKDLNLEYNDLSRIPAELLAKVVTRLHYVNLHGTIFSSKSSKQITHLFKVISTTSTTLKKIFLFRVDVSNISAEVLAVAICKIENVHLQKTYLTVDQKLQTLIKALHPTSPLQNLELSHGSSISLRSVCKNPKLLNLDLSRQEPSLPPSFMMKLLDKVSESKTLFRIDLSGNNLSSIPASLISKVVSDLHGHTLNLHNTMLSTEAITSILQVLLQSKRIKNLNLSDNTLTNVSPDLLASVADMVSEICLDACCLSAEQSTKVLQTSAMCYMKFNDLSKVHPDIIYNRRIFKQYTSGIVKQETPDSLLCNTSLSTQQVKIIFQKYCESEEILVNFKISHQDLSKVPVGLLSKFVSKFSNVSLTNCHLTKKQMTGILQRSFKPTNLKYLDLYGNILSRSMTNNLMEKLYELMKTKLPPGMGPPEIPYCMRPRAPRDMNQPSMGMMGPPRPRGMMGPPGPQRMMGPLGPWGMVGPLGPQQIMGPPEPQRIMGPLGHQRLMGPPGPQQMMGPPGPQRIMRPSGPQGIMRPPGPQGMMGPPGTRRLMGPPGPQRMMGPPRPQ